MQDTELLDKIQKRVFKYQRKQSSIINNFFTIITIAIMSIVIIWYVNFILPGQKNDQIIQEKNIKKIELLKEKQNKRLEQIKLSKRLNAKS